METKHTPGPWFTHKADSRKNSDYIVYDRRDESQVAKVYAWHTSGADAHLIAAAPDLLQSVYDLVSCLTCKAIADGKRDDIKSYVKTRRQRVVVCNALKTLKDATGGHHGSNEQNEG